MSGGEVILMPFDFTGYFEKAGGWFVFWGILFLESSGKRVWGTSWYISSPLDLFLCCLWIYTRNVWILSLAWAY